MATTVLHDLGYTLLAGRNPERVLELARQHTGPIHLFVTNLTIPDMSAAELVNAVREIRPDVKVLFMSGSGAADQPAGLPSCGVGYLQKPFSVLALAMKVREVLENT
jgi:DNA-binding NtrC family response regulator